MMPALISPTELALRLGISRRKIIHFCDSGALKSVRLTRNPLGHRSILVADIQVDMPDLWAALRGSFEQSPESPVQRRKSLR